MRHKNKYNSYVFSIVIFLFTSIYVSAETFTVNHSNGLAQSNEIKSFYDEADKVIFKPLLNEDVYDTKLVSFEPIKSFDYKPSDFECGSNKGSRTNKFDSSKIASIAKGELIPYRLQFKVSLNKKYINGISKLFDENSENQFNTDMTSSPNIFKLGRLAAYGTPTKSILNVTKSYLLSPENSKSLQFLAKDYAKRLQLAAYLDISLNDNNSSSDNEESFIKIVYAQTNYRFGVANSNLNFSIDSGMLMTMPNTTDNVCVSSEIIDRNYYYMFGMPYTPNGGFESNYNNNMFPFVESDITYSVVAFLSPEQANKIKNININVVWTTNDINLHKKKKKTSQANAQPIKKNPAIEKLKTYTNPPRLKFQASISDGFAPLDVDFYISAQDDKKISGYYINLAGKEIIADGQPPASIKKTFYTAGEFKVIAIVKNEDGLMTEQTLVIKVKEKTFSDYKKIYE